MEVILAYLEHQEYPEDYSKQQKRDLRKRTTDFTLKDGMLYCLGNRKNFSKPPRQVIFDQKTQQHIIRWDRHLFFNVLFFVLICCYQTKVSLSFDILRK